MNKDFALFGLVPAALLVLLSGLPSEAQAPPQATNLRMQKVVRAFVKEYGDQVIGQGSWISGKGYSDLLMGGTSDHDLRLLVSSRNGARSLEMWRNARSRLAMMVRDEFGRDADRVLARVNLYPPSQLMTGVEGLEDAVQRFRELGTVPNLSVAEGVPRDAARYAEGLYGPGSPAAVQEYERSSGRLFYREGKNAYMGMTDLTHMSEGISRYDTEGMANTSRQWAEHLDDSLRRGNAREVAKYIRRVNRDLAKAKDLVRLDMDMAWRTELNTLEKELARDPKLLSSLQPRIEKAIVRARQEAAVLREFARSGEAGRKILGEVLKDIGGGGRMRRILAAASDAVDFDTAVRAVLLYVEIRRSTAAAAEGDFQKAYTAALAGTLGMVSLPPALAVELGAWVLEAAKEAGINFFASTQDAWNLMAGLYTATGRTDLDTGRAYSLDDLVRGFDDEARLEALVRAKAMLAADRELSDVNRREDARVAEAIFRRCWPVILDAWRMKRELLAVEYENLANEIGRTPVLMTYAPVPAVAAPGKPTAVTVTARIAGEGFDRKRERMKEILNILCRTSSYVNLYWNWAGGREGANPWIRHYEFEGAGVKAVTLKLEVRAGATGKWGASPLTRTIECVSGLDVLIEGEAAAGGAPALRWVLEGVEEAVQEARDDPEKSIENRITVSPGKIQGSARVRDRDRALTAANAFETETHTMTWIVLLGPGGSFTGKERPLADFPPEIPQFFAVQGWLKLEPMYARRGIEMFTDIGQGLNSGLGNETAFTSQTMGWGNKPGDKHVLLIGLKHTAGTGSRKYTYVLRSK